MSPTTYHVRCRVSGGITGTREALLKSNGVLQEFPSLAAAKRAADELNVRMNHEHAVATFQYWPVAATERPTDLD